MPAASMNVVLTVSGLKAAKYLHQQFGTPYVTMAPFGEKWSELLIERIRGQQLIESDIPKEEDPQLLIVGEQLMANAIRETLMREYGIKRIQVASFYKLSKELAAPHDIRIRDEDDAKKIFGEGNYRMIIADPLLKMLSPKTVKWLDLPHKVFSLYGETKQLPMLLGKQLNEWLEK